MAYVLDASAILAVLLGDESAAQVVDLLQAAARQTKARVMVPFSALEELELFLLRRAPGHADRALAMVEAWPIEIVEAYPQWRREATLLRANLNLPRPVAWTAALALLHQAELVAQDPAFDSIPGLTLARIT